MIPLSRIKVFVERTWANRPAGSQPHQWDFIPRFTTGEVPLDQQVNEWLAKTKVKLVSVSPPGVYHYWLDDAYKNKCVVMSVTVVYEEVSGNEQVAETDPAKAAALIKLLSTGQVSTAGPGPDGPINWEEEQARLQEEEHDRQARDSLEGFGNIDGDATTGPADRSPANTGDVAPGAGSPSH